MPTHPNVAAEKLQAIRACNIAAMKEGVIYQSVTTVK